MRAYIATLHVCAGLALVFAGMLLGQRLHPAQVQPTRAAVLVDCGAPAWVVLEAGGSLYIASWREIRRQPTLTDWFTRAAVIRRSVGCGASL